MQTNIEKTKTRTLVYSLLGSGLAVLVANAFGKDTATVVTDFLNVSLSGLLLVLSITITVKNRIDGNHGKAYLMFTAFAISWFIAEVIWFISEIIYHLSPFPQEAEWCYLVGYPFLLLFSMYYLKPFKIAIQKKVYWYAFLTSMTFLIPTLYTTYSYNPNSDFTQILWAALYPTADAVMLFPAVLGMVLFFRGKVGLLWSLAFLAIILNIIADSGFLFLDVDKSYYTGNPIDILYLWAYILFTFGIYSHIEMFKSPKKKSFGDLEDLK
ncbi:MAG TPA: hypothetical protein VET47_00115 [Candidatus Limnocylindrales bacterium]|nr:hypothetical protein [Candidatus Limnocylindrales bacterium]